MADRYERITYRPEGAKRSRTVILRGVSETPYGPHTLISGAEVDRHGSDRRRLHVIDAALVRKRTALEMDLHYAELVPEGTARHPLPPASGSA